MSFKDFERMNQIKDTSSSTLSQSIKNKIDAWMLAKIVSQKNILSAGDYSAFIYRLITRIQTKKTSLPDLNKVAIINYILSEFVV